jgi:hypothetical protein
MLVNEYLRTGNYAYYTLHIQSFLQDYEAWCNTPSHQRTAMKPFASLLLQVAALATQGLAGALAQHIEYELGESTDQTSRNFHSAAVRLSRTISPGSGGVHQGLQWLLAASWAKSEGCITEAWHFVSAAVREEQECGKD